MLLVAPVPTIEDDEYDEGYEDGYHDGYLDHYEDGFDDGYIDDGDFRDFTFGNVVTMHTGMNPDFFKGTVVEQAVADELGLK